MPPISWHQALKDDEMFIADGGYRDKHGWSRTPSGYKTREQYMQAVCRARHETVNRYFKVFGAMRQQWRNHRVKHGIAFWAAANVVQARIQLEPTIFQVHYHERLRYHLRKLKLKHHKKHKH